MKKSVLVFSLVLLAILQLQAQAGRIVGIWLTENKNSQVEIYQTSGGTFEGKLVWLEDPLDEDGRPKRDKENPDRSLRTRPLKGIVLLKDFTYHAGSREWREGTIYDPESGRTYSAYMKLEDQNTLRLRGFVMGMRFLGRTSTWTRESQRRN